MADRDMSRVLRHIRQSLSGESGLSDAQLLEQFAFSGDPSAFKMLLRRHERLVWSVLRRVLHDFHDGEEAFQATFLALARKAGSISSGEAVACWLYKVAFRTALAVRAKRGRHAAQLEPLQAADKVAAPVEFQQSAEWLEIRAVLDEEVNRLPYRFRAPIILCYLEGKTVDEAAVELGCPRGTVASRLARAREKLRIRLTGRDIAISGAGLAAGLALPGLSLAAPFRLVGSTIRLVKIYLAGKAAAGAVLPASIVALTEEVLRAMLIKKLIFVVAVMIVSTGFLLVGTGAGMQLYRAAAEEAGPQAAPAPIPKAQAKAEQKEPPAKEQDDPKKPTVSMPEKREVAPYKVFTGRLEASEKVDVSAPVSGRLGKILCQSGAAVKKGDVLFELEATGFKEDLIKAEVTLRSAKALSHQSDASLQLAQEAWKSNAASKQEVDKAARSAALDRAAADLAQLELNRAQRELNSTIIKAPVDGKVGKILVNAGGGVSGEKTVLTTIAVVDPLHAVFLMDEGHYNNYQWHLREKEVSGPGSPLSFSLSNIEGIHKGKLASFDDHFEPNTGTIMVRATLPNPDGQLLPGMSGRVEMAFGKPQPKLLVPETAIQRSDNPAFPQRFVVVINEKNIVEDREVTLGLAYGSMRVIEEGLSPNERIFVNANDGAGHVGDKIEQRKK